MALQVERLMELLAVAEAGSIAAAAEASGVTRSTLSRRLSALEQELGLRLLQRHARALSLTHAGEILVDHARRISAEADDAWRLVRGLRAQPAGPLRVSTPPTALFEDLLVGFAVAHPAVRVLVQATDRHVDLVKENIDVALRFGTVTNEGLIVRRIGSTRSALVAAPAYLTTHGRPTLPADLGAHRCIVGYGQSGIPSARWPLRAGGGYRVEPHFACPGLTASLSAAIAGLGIALLPDPLTAAARASGDLEHVLHDVVGAQLTGQLVFSERRMVLPAVRSFIDYTVDFYRGHVTAIAPGGTAGADGRRR